MAQLADMSLAVCHQSPFLGRIGFWSKMPLFFNGKK